MRLEYKGKFTSGYYNAMEAGYPVFIDGQSLSDIVKNIFASKGLNRNFCDDGYSLEDESVSDNKLIGKKVRLILEIEDS